MGSRRRGVGEIVEAAKGLIYIYMAKMANLHISHLITHVIDMELGIKYESAICQTHLHRPGCKFMLVTSQEISLKVIYSHERVLLST